MTIKKALALLLTAALLIPGCSLGEGETQGQYTLDRVVVLSRHNIRSPLSGPGSTLYGITPYEWFHWTSSPSELSLRGGVAETMMGQYFRQWLEEEGLFAPNAQPAQGEVRIYANAKQRTIATARYFAAGMFPVAQVPVEVNAPYDTMDPVFWPKLNFVTEEYARDAEAQIARKGGAAGLKGIHAGLMDEIKLLMEVTGMDQSPAYQAGEYGDLLRDDMQIVLEEGKEPAMLGPVRTATSVADALILQYYEEEDAEKAAFGHSLSLSDWQRIHAIVDVYSEALFGEWMIAVNVAHPLLEEMRTELTAENRKFTFLCGHDSNLASVLAALGVEEYLLPDTAEQHTPIGSKLVFSRWLNGEGEAFYTVELVYQSTAQLRAGEMLSRENPPLRFALHFDGAAENPDGMLAEQDMLDLFDQAIQAYDELLDRYAEPEALENAA